MRGRSDASSNRALDPLFARLSRRTTSGRYIPEIDGLRFVCISLVLLFHIRVVLGLMGKGGASGFHGHGLLDLVLAQGQFGVELFFMISGFVLALPFAAHRLLGGPRPRLGAYYLRRLTRLEPPYLLTMTLCFLLVPMIVPSSYRLLAPHYLAGLGYLNGLIFRDLNPVNTPAWSLEVEVQFYLLVPALAVLFATGDAQLRRVRILNVALAGYAVQALLTRLFTLPDLTLLSFFQFFLVGFLLADVYLTTWHSNPVTSRAWDLVSLVGWPLLFVLAAWNVPAVIALVFPGVAGLVLCAAFKGRWTRAVLTNRWITTIGGMCYSIYLIHLPFMVWLSRAFRPLLGSSFALNVLILGGGLLPAVVVAGTIFYATIERPCMEPDWPARALARVRRRAPAPRRRSMAAAETVTAEDVGL